MLDKVKRYMPDCRRGVKRCDALQDWKVLFVLWVSQDLRGGAEWAD